MVVIGSSADKKRRYIVRINTLRSKNVFLSQLGGVRLSIAAAITPRLEGHYLTADDYRMFAVSVPY